MTTEVSSRTIWRERGPLPNDWIAVYSMHDGNFVYLTAHINLSAKALWDLIFLGQTVYNEGSLLNLLSSSQVVFVRESLCSPAQ